MFFGFSNIKLLFKLFKINLMRHINTIYALTISFSTFTLKIKENWDFNKKVGGEKLWLFMLKSGKKLILVLSDVTNKIILAIFQNNISKRKFGEILQKYAIKYT